MANSPVTDATVDLSQPSRPPMHGKAVKSG
jgi:hypothetical protein